MDKMSFDMNGCIKKYSPSEKREIMKAFKKLNDMILIQEQHIPFEKIFNNDKIKYDIFGNDFYTFKAHGKDNAQIRLLYRFIRLPGQKFRLEIHMVNIKRRKDKDYIKEFQRYVTSTSKHKGH